MRVERVSRSMGRLVPVTTSTPGVAAAAIMAWLKGVPPMRSQKTMTPSQVADISEIAAASLSPKVAASSSWNDTDRKDSCGPPTISSAPPTPSAKVPCPVRMQPTMCASP